MLLAWLDSALLGLSRSTIDPKSQISSTCKSGRYPLQVRIIHIAQKAYATIHIPILNHILMGKLKRASWLRLTYSGIILSLEEHVSSIFFLFRLLIRIFCFSYCLLDTRLFPVLSPVCSCIFYSLYCQFGMLLFPVLSHEHAFFLFPVLYCIMKTRLFLLFCLPNMHLLFL